MPRFAILQHDQPVLHWDFLLESGDVLRAWRLLELPVPDRAIPAEPSFDHRLLYLDYEGPVSGGRGWVTRWDVGEYHLASEGSGWLLLRLQGRRLAGQVELVKEVAGEQWYWRLNPLPAGAGEPWV